jgi:CDP-paratose 2-epimerase
MKKSAGRNVLITGGAGFIGSNLAARLLKDPSANVHIFDNFSRRGVERNLRWLSSLANSSRLTVTSGDVRDRNALRKAASEVTEIYHFAAQVAVTTSLIDPILDCEVNLVGTINMLEAARRSMRRPFILFTSTNKVYGSLPELEVVRQPTRYWFRDSQPVGIGEDCPLDFHSPYGCSKGAADQYVHDYARIYNLPTVVFRMSCIAGPRQFGNEDQGWVAHFLYSALQRRPITIYGDGRQVRDVLHVYDLVEAMCAVCEYQTVTAGQVYNVGGGPNRASSVLEILKRVQEIVGENPRCNFAKARPGDQQLYVTDYNKLHQHTGWMPKRNLDKILEDITLFWEKDVHMRGIRREEKIRAVGVEKVA